MCTVGEILFFICVLHGHGQAVLILATSVNEHYPVGYISVLCINGIPGSRTYVFFFFISVQQSTCVNASLFTYIDQTPEPSLHPASLHNVATASCRKIPPFSIALWIIKVVAIPYGKEFSLLPIVNNKISGSVRPGNGHQTLGVQSCSQNNIINRLTQTFQGHCGQIVKVKGREKIFHDIYWISVVNCAVRVACKKTICSFVFINDDWTSYSPNVSHWHLKYFEVLVS